MHNFCNVLRTRASSMEHVSCNQHEHQLTDLTAPDGKNWMSLAKE